MVDVLAPSAKMNAPGGSRYLHARHFTTPDEGAMHNQSTDCALSKEERCLEAIKSGRISIDSEGRVWKHWRLRAGGSVQHYNPPRRADKMDKIGYCRIGIRIDGKTVIVYAHRLVWVYRNGAIPAGKELNHKDGNKRNNQLDNLELVTRSENLLHAHNVTDSFTKNGIRYTTISKMDPEKDAEAFGRRLLGETWETIGAHFGISAASVQRAINRHKRRFS